MEDRLPAGWRSVLSEARLGQCHQLLKMADVDRWLPRAKSPVPTIDHARETPEKLSRKLKHAEKALAGEMRNSGICVFEGWSTGVLTELSVYLAIRQPDVSLICPNDFSSFSLAQAMLSSCVVASVAPTIQAGEQGASLELAQPL